MKTNNKIVYRNSKDGKFVKPGFAKKHPSTTEKEKIKTGKR
jgi:hypothetical protein